MESKETEVSDNLPASYVQMYFEHQFDRMGRLEDQRLMISNIVITMSVVAFSFGFETFKDLSIINGLGLPLIMIISNLFAIAYITRAGKSIASHRSRANKVLQKYAPALQKISDSSPWERSGLLGSRTVIQRRLHYLLILIALMPIVIYFYYFNW